MMINKINLNGYGETDIYTGCNQWSLGIAVEKSSPFVAERCVLQEKAGPRKDIYPYVIQELKPTLTELGISTPEELGIDKLQTVKVRQHRHHMLHCRVIEP